TLLPAGSGWVLQSAAGISDGGQIAGTGTLNGVTRGFLLSPPIDILLFAGGAIDNEDSNLPRGVEVGKTITFVLSAIAPMEDPVTVYGGRVTDRLPGPAEYVSAGSGDNAATCHVEPKTVTCDLPPFDSIGLGSEVWFTVRTTGPGGISHESV